MLCPPRLLSDTQQRFCVTAFLLICVVDVNKESTSVLCVLPLSPLGNVWFIVAGFPAAGRGVEDFQGVHRQQMAVSHGLSP